ncbi:MAG: phospholipid carrier-dependent glycosyltransferase [Streptosporangiaceae bacterium]|nr:phospholipid carrier-dependent glycosyltransferase [Streptosporangiaceae bacterium]
MRLAEGEARGRFAAVPVARPGTADGRGRPHVVVVTFAVDGDTSYTAVDQEPKSGTLLKRLRNSRALVRVGCSTRAMTVQAAGTNAPTRKPVAARTAVTKAAAAKDRMARGLRRHWPFAVLLGLAAALRAVVLAAYRPALIFPDSVRYLQYAADFTAGRWSPDGLRQSGYSVLIIPAVLLHDMWLIPLVQHLTGLATAVLGYAVLVRFGVRTWLAAAAAIPVLFDPLQVVLEQYVLADTWTVFLVSAALAILAWPSAWQGHKGQEHKEQRGKGLGEEGRGQALRWRPAATCGLLLGVAVTLREADLIMIVAAAVYLAVAVRPRRRLVRRLATLTGCFLVPVAGYLGWFDAAHGEPGFTTFAGAFLYGRVADFASCQGLNLPAYEEPLCPSQPPAARNANFYQWDPRSPQWTFQPPPGTSRDAAVRDFSLRIARHQPLGYARAVGRDFAYGFSPVRGAGPERDSPAYLQFRIYIRPDRQADASIAALGYQPPAVRPGPAAFLAGYGRWFYVPGPVFAAALVLALAVLVATRRGRQPDARDACLLFTAGAVLMLVPPALFAAFDWRYQLPQLTLIPVAAALAAAAVGGRRGNAAR